MNTLKQAIARSRSGFIYATVVEVTGNFVNLRLNSGKRISRVSVVGGPVVIGQRVKVQWVGGQPQVSATYTGTTPIYQPSSAPVTSELIAARFDTFLELTDTPDDYTGQAGKIVTVKSVEDGLEFSNATGDMLKATYDPDLDDIVEHADLADAAPWTGVTGKPSTFPPDTHTHVEANITDLDHDAQKIKAIPVDTPVVGDDGKVLTYDHAVPKFKLAAAGGGAGTFTGLTDTPANYSGQAGKVVSIKATEDGLEFTAAGSPYPPAWQPDPDQPPSTPNAIDDEFDGASLDPKWTFHNVVSDTFTVAYHRLYIDSPIRTTRIVGVTQPAPTAPWVIRCQASFATGVDAYNLVGMFVRNITTGKNMSVGIFMHDDVNWRRVQQLYVQKVGADYVSFDGEAFLWQLRTPGNCYYLEIANSGTNLSFRYSADGFVFKEIFSEDIATYIGSVDQIGVQNMPWDQANIASFHWFRRIS